MSDENVQDPYVLIFYKDRIFRPEDSDSNRNWLFNANSDIINTPPNQTCLLQHPDDWVTDGNTRRGWPTMAVYKDLIFIRQSEVGDFAEYLI